MHSYFFLNDKLHKYIKTIISENAVVAWSYPDEQRMWYDRSQVRRDATKAYRFAEVARLLKRSTTFLRDLMFKNLIDRPSVQSYNIATRRPSVYFWSQEDILALRQQLFDMAPKNRYGEPNGKFKLVSEAELK